MNRSVTRVFATCLLGGSLLIGCQVEGDDLAPAVGSTQAPLIVPDDAIDGQYIVVFKDEAPASELSAAMNRVALRSDNQLLHSYSVIPGFAAKLSDQSLEALLSNPSVAYIEQDAVVTLDTTYPNPPNGLDRVDQRTGRDSSYNDYNRDGGGVHVYIVDTGIRATHSEFTGRVGAGTDTVDNDSDPTDCHGHGTHVASTAVGTQYGLAKQATVHAVRVLNCQGSGTNSGVIAGVDWVSNNHVSPAVANMSLGGSAYQALDDAVNNAVASGVTFAVAAGNDNANACNYSPARAADAITVGATEDTSDARASFSNYGSCLDIFAPGRNILGAWYNSDTATNTISGTSMATPHVAGAAALYLSGNPTATPAEVLNAMLASATDSCVTSAGSGSPNKLLHNNFDDTTGAPHCDSGGEPPPGGGNPNSCAENNACDAQAPGGCWCDVWCLFTGDCCDDFMECLVI